MAMFSERHTGYKVGVVLFCIGVVAFIVGFASPYWTIEGNTHAGLWEACREENRFWGSSCSSLASGKGEKVSWFSAVQALQSLALIGFLLAGCYAFYTNWCSKYRVSKRYLEVVIGFSAVLGLTGAIIFAAGQVHKMGKRHDWYRLSFGFYPVDWSFIVDVTGCMLTIVAAIFIAVFNRPLPADTPSTTFQPMLTDVTAVPGSTPANANPAVSSYIALQPADTAKVN